MNADILFILAQIFFIPDVNAFFKDADAKSYDADVIYEDANAIFHDANVPCGDVNAKFIHDRCEFVGVPWCRCPLEGMSWCQCPLKGMSWCKCPLQMFLLDTDAILTKNFFYSQIEAYSEPEVKIFFKIWLILSKCHFLFIPGHLTVQCIILAPKKSYFDLRFSQSWWSLLEFSEWDINLGSNDLVWKDLFPQVGWENGECVFLRPFLEIKILWKSAVFKKIIHFSSLNMMIWSSIKTYRDSLEKIGKGILEQRVQTFWFWKGLRTS